MTEITKLFEKCLSLHKYYKYVEEKENLKKFAEFSLDEVLSFIQAYRKTENYNDKKAEVFHSISSNLMESQQDNSVKELEKAIELDPNRAFYYEEYFNKFYTIKPKESIIFIKKAIQLNSNKESLYQHLVILLKEIEFNEEAIKIIELIQDFPKSLSDLVSYIDDNISTYLLGLEN